MPLCIVRTINYFSQIRYIVVHIQATTICPTATWAVNGTTVAGSSLLGGGSTPQQLSNPTDVYADSAGSIYVADSNNNRVQKWLVGASNGTTVVPGSAGTGLNQFSSSECFSLSLSMNASFMYLSARHQCG